MGASYRLPFHPKLLISVDIDKGRDTSVKWHYGAEYSLLKTFKIRVGQDRDIWTAGIGLRYKDIAVDYAFNSQEFGDTHKLAAGIYFGPTMAELQEALRKKEEAEVSKRLEAELLKQEELQLQKLLATGKEYLDKGAY